MPRRLKVFQAQFGFWDCVVAAPSQAAALRAWGTRQNLFSAGEAREVKDEGVVATALAHPETPLRRAVGSSDPFSLEPRLPDAPRATRRPARPRPVVDPTKLPDRGALDDAEAALGRLADRRAYEMAAFDRRRNALAAEEADAGRVHASALLLAEQAVERCRKAFLKVGGRAKG